MYTVRLCHSCAVVTTCRFSLPNQREPVVFFFMHNATADNGFSNLSYAGKSAVINVTNPNEPLHGHLALTQDPT